MSLILSGTDGLSDVDGSAATPAIRGTDANTGIFFPAADTIAFAEGGVEAARFDSSGKFGINVTPAAGTDAKLQVTGGTTNVTSLATSYSAATIAIVPKSTSGYSLAIASGTGDHPQLQVSAGGAASGNLLLQPYGGNVGIGTTTTTRAILNIDTDGSNNASGYGLALTNLAGGGTTWTLQCGDYAVSNGAFTIRQTGISGTTYFKIEASTGYITVPGVYTLTTGSAANVFVGTGGDLRRSTSSLKYKTDIQDATHGLAEVMQLRPVIYKGINDGETVFGGFIAEEVDALGLTEFVQYADDGSPDALAYGNMVSLLTKAIQEQQALITALTARITALETAP